MALPGVLSGVTVAPRRVLLYGTNGIGKSTWAAGAPSPIFVPTEDGLGEIGPDRFPLATSYDQVLAHLATLANEQHAYQTVVLDSLDWLEKLVWKKTCEDRKVKSIDDAGYGKGYGYAMDYWREVMSALAYLRAERGMTTILLAHCAIKRIELPDADGFDAYTPAIHRSALATVCEWCDEVFLAAYRVYTKKATEGFATKTKALGDGERVLYTSARPHRVAKNRLDLPDELAMPRIGAWDEYAKQFTKQEREHGKS